MSIVRGPSAAISVSIIRDNVVDSWCSLIENSASKDAQVMEPGEFHQRIPRTQCVCQRAESAQDTLHYTRIFGSDPFAAARLRAVYQRPNYGGLDTSWF
jgi:hypothetical protein